MSTPGGFDVDAFLDGYQRPVEEVAVCAKAGLVAEHARVEAEIIGHRTAAGLGGPPVELLARLEELEAEIEESVVVFRLQALSFREWSDLLAEHPPTSEQAKVGHGSNPDTLNPRLLAACAVEPPLTVEQAERMRDTLPPSEWEALIAALRIVNREQTSAPKSLLASVARLTNAASPDTQPSEESPEAGSLADNGEQ